MSVCLCVAIYRKGTGTFQICTHAKALQNSCSVQVDMRLDKRHVHGEEFSIAFSRSISVELDSEGSIVSTCTLNFEDVTSLISDIIFLYQLAKAHPRKVLHF